MAKRVNSVLMLPVLMLLLGPMLSCQSPGGLYDLEQVGPQHFGYLFKRTLERKVEIDELREIQCPCVPESGIDVDRYSADFRNSYEREEYEEARGILIALELDVDSYSRSMTDARCHWTVSAEKFEAPDNPVECLTDK